MRTCIQLDGSFHFSYLQLPALKFELTGRPIKPLKRSTKTIFFLFYLCIIKLYLQTPSGPIGWLELTTSSVTPTKEKLIGQFSPDDRMISPSQLIVPRFSARSPKFEGAWTKATMNVVEFYFDFFLVSNKQFQSMT